MNAIALIFLVAVQSPPHTCLLGARAVVGDSGVGAVRLWITDEELRERCRIVRDTVVANDDFVEAERVLFVVIGRDTVQAAVDSGRVARIYVDSPRFRTTDSLGVGTRLRTLAKPGASGGQSEATFGVVVPGHCGLRFVISGIRGVEQGDDLDHSKLRRQPLSAHVKRVEIVGCSR